MNKLYKIVMGNTVYYYPNAECMEHAIQQKTDLMRMQLANVIICGSNVIKCRWDLEDIMDVYHEKLNESLDAYVAGNLKLDGSNP